MIRRPAQPSFTSRVCGHSFGVLGVVMGLNAIATSINPALIRFFPFRDTGIQQLSAALVGVGLIALALWMVAERRRRVTTADLDPRKRIERTRDQ
ncbi:MAG TPA: hypothetical protein VGL83_01290 [Stellaceae bacterium]|jgi:hypothetical protein